jgi:hypothetical protein
MQKYIYSIMMSFSKHILFGKDSTRSKKDFEYSLAASDEKLASPGWVCQMSKVSKPK